jgi:uncharacterized protein YkwD
MRVPSHRARQTRAVSWRAWLALAACVAVLAIVAGRVLLANTAGPGSLRTDAADRRPATGTPRGSGSARPAPRPRAAPAASRQPAPESSSPATSPASPSATPPAGSPTSPAAPSPSPSSSPSPGGSDSAAASSVLALINQARAQAGLPAYTILSGLQVSSARHNQLMAAGCGLSHQCPGEPALGARETAAGVSWTAAGENIGEGGPVATTAAAITQMADALTQDMLNEKPPDDGHRLNILSSTFTHIGIAVYRSADGTVWMTQDFAN